MLPLLHLHTRRRARRQRASGAARSSRAVLGLTAAVTAAAITLYVLLLRGQPPLEGNLHLAWWALAPAFLLGELCAVHVHFRRSALTLTLSEIPLVAGLLLASPTDLLIGQLIGAGVVLAVSLHRTPLRLAFNVVQFALVTCVAALVLQALATSGPSSHGTWLAVLVATAVSGQLAILLIAIAMALSERRVDLRRLPGMLGPGLVVSATNAALALAGVLVATRDPMAFTLLVVPGVTVFLAYRAYLAARRQHARLEFLHEATRALGNAREVASGLEELLERTVAMFRTEWGEVVLLPAQDADPPLLLRHGREARGLRQVDPEVAEALHAAVAADVRAQVIDARRATGVLADHLHLHGVENAVLVPLPGETRLVGTLMLANRVGVEAPYRSDELRLFETLAQQAGAWLENDRLEQTVWRLGELQAKLEHQAYHDPLTGLANRALFTRCVEEALAEPDGEVAVLFLDLDEFKSVNDTLGHSVGDSLLVAVGDRLRETLPAGALAARFGGDEFAVLLTRAAAATAEQVAELITASMLEPVRIGSRELVAHASIGLATADSECADADELLRRADVAMYAAKGAGRMQVALFDPALDEEVLRRHELVADLETAIKRREFVAHYQPIVDLASGRTVAVEALVRWQSPTRGMVPPGLFIEVAEEAGLIVHIGRAVLEQACGQLRALEEAFDAPGLAMHVNLSPLEFSRPDLVDRVRDIVRRHDVPPGQLVLEVTETAVMQHGGAAQDALQRLRDLGIRIALDDFGTGWSSLGLLRKLPVDIVKIAKEFVDEIAHDADAAAFVRMMLDLFRTLRLPVVTEGVEEADQAAVLRRLRCAMAQGYLFARPAPAEAFSRTPALAA